MLVRPIQSFEVQWLMYTIEERGPIARGCEKYSEDNGLDMAQPPCTLHTQGLHTNNSHTPYRKPNGSFSVPGVLTVLD